MAKGKLVPPNLDDRSWQDIVKQARALIPTYAPEWTDHNPSDLGITLVELFSWLAEGLIYRLNRVPEKNFVTFLNLIGVTRDPATPASTYLTYRLASAASPLTIPKGNQAATQQTEDEEAIIFETDRDLLVLPINLTTALNIVKYGGPVQYTNITSKIVGSPLTGVTIERPAFESFMICLGFDSTSTGTVPLHCSFAEPAKEGNIYISWHYSQGATEPTSWPMIPTVTDETEGFQKNGTASFSIPGDWASQNPKDWSGVPPKSAEDKFDQSRLWIGIRIITFEPLSLGLEHLLMNSVPATNALTVLTPEFLGTSTGKPFQLFDLAHQPLFKQPGAANPYDHLIVRVREPLVGGGFGPWTKWTSVDDFPAGPGDFYRLNPVTGTIDFGNFEATIYPDGHGSIPPAGSEIQAVTYRYVAGGANGNVPPDSINVIRTPLPGLVSATNLGPATGGSNEEAMEDTMRRGPEVLRNRYRAVTVEDYEYLAREATTDINKVRCLPPRLFTSYDTLPPGLNVGDPWTYGGLNRDVGNVNVIIIPEASLSNPTPMPSAALLQEVSDYLQDRRVVTNLFHVTHPRYLPINVKIDIRVWQKALDTGLVISLNDEENKVRAKITEFLHPIVGGPEGTGWQIGQDIFISALFDFIRLDSEVGFISTLTVEAGTPLYEPIDRPFPTGIPSVWVQLVDYELICSGSHTVKASAI